MKKFIDLDNVLYEAIKINDNLKMIQALLKAGANPNQGKNLLHLAILEQDHPLVKILIEENIDVNEFNQGKSAIDLAIEKNDEQSILLLLANGAPVEYNRFSLNVAEVLNKISDITYYSPKLTQKNSLKIEANNNSISISRYKNHCIDLENRFSFPTNSDLKSNSHHDYSNAEINVLFVDRFNNKFNKKAKILFGKEVKNYQNDKGFKFGNIVDFGQFVTTNIKKQQYFSDKTDLVEEIYNSNKLLQIIFEDFEAFHNNIINPISLKFQVMLKILLCKTIDKSYKENIYEILPVELLTEINILSKILTGKVIPGSYYNIENITNEDIKNIIDSFSSYKNSDVKVEELGEAAIQYQGDAI